MPQGQGQPETKVVALRVPVDLIVFLRAQAQANHRTVSGEIRRLIDEYQAACQREAA